MVTEQRDKDIKHAMRKAGVSIHIDKQPFTDEPYRNHVGELFGIMDNFKKGDKLLGVNIFPDKIRNSYETQTLFWLLAKHSVLKHKNTKCVQPMDIINLHRSDELHTLDCSVIFIQDYSLDVHQIPNQYNKNDAVTVRWFIKQCIKEGRQIFLLSDCSLEASGLAFWGTGFATNLRKRIKNYKMEL